VDVVHDFAFRIWNGFKMMFNIKLKTFTYKQEDFRARI
jgi:hypothetical protein